MAVQCPHCGAAVELNRAPRARWRALPRVPPRRGLIVDGAPRPPPPPRCPASCAPSAATPGSPAARAEGGGTGKAAVARPAASSGSSGSVRSAWKTMPPVSASWSTCFTGKPKAVTRARLEQRFRHFPAPVLSGAHRGAGAAHRVTSSKTSVSRLRSKRTTPLRCMPLRLGSASTGRGSSSPPSDLRSRGVPARRFGARGPRVREAAEAAPRRPGCPERCPDGAGGRGSGRRAARPRRGGERRPCTGTASSSTAMAGSSPPSRWSTGRGPRR
jgi:hypothetical protein